LNAASGQATPVQRNTITIVGARLAFGMLGWRIYQAGGGLPRVPASSGPPASDCLLTRSQPPDDQILNSESAGWSIK
jgi:hypothetical protein